MPATLKNTPAARMTPPTMSSQRRRTRAPGRRSARFSSPVASSRRSAPAAGRRRSCCSAPWTTLRGAPPPDPDRVEPALDPDVATRAGGCPAPGAAIASCSRFFEGPQVAMAGIHGSNPRPAPPGATPDQDFHRQIRSDLTGFFCGNLAGRASDRSRRPRGARRLVRGGCRAATVVRLDDDAHANGAVLAADDRELGERRVLEIVDDLVENVVGVECQRVGGGEREAARLASGAGVGQLAVGVDVRDRSARPGRPRPTA